MVGLILVVAAAVLLLSGGGDDADQPSSAGSTPVVAATTLPADLDWQPIRDAPFRRQYAATTAVGGRIWVLGGVGVKDVKHDDEGVRPGHRQVDDRPGATARPAPFHGCDLQG